jgi:DNA-binding GntR family transcriptional regulator
MSSPNLLSGTPSYGTQIEGAYEGLRQAIIDGTLAPSTKLRIEFLRGSFSFGASALREALSRLVSDGLVEFEAQRGYWVAPISLEDFLDITASRKVIEVEALRQSIQQGSLDWESQLVAASHSLQRVENSMQESSRDVIMGWERANRAFHMALVAGCPLRWLLRCTGLLYDQSQRYRHRTELQRPIPRRGLSPDHKEILAAALDRKADIACAALTRHIDNTARGVEKAIFGAERPRAAAPAKQLVSFPKNSRKRT